MRKLKMMVVDDSNVIRRKIQRARDADRFLVVGVATNGREAVAQYKRLSPDLVTMDITMPEMDGIACIKEIINFEPGARILVISALADKATGIEALEQGARGFLCKPFNDDDLARALNEMMED